jgi:hypothetical protein
MSDLARYLTESEYQLHHPVAGDDFGIELEDGTLIDTWIMESDEDSLLLAATPEIMDIMESWMELDLYESDRDEDAALLEAEYQGHKVPLGKPMRGDVKKFKVYVKDPKTGNVKKVNFGHGGKSARRAGQKTMRIKKSNPARRKSFRARHHCSNPGPRTGARYWSCRAW